MSEKAKWVVNRDFWEPNRFRAFAKRHPKETGACLDNLEKVRGALSDHGQPGAFHFNFFRSEGGDIWRIGQTNVGHACETRLYVYLYVKGATVYVLTIGDKSQQRHDIQRCRELAKEIEKRC